ncbi:membrane protein [Anopheles sinensis]|uniref:Membrane protein n=1 Tax=Anopheles sinensis TaxID=74873 RepID=A0A084WLA3_ANOSI|nr:membrane protein [Anopheles sinensis]
MAMAGQRGPTVWDLHRCRLSPCAPQKGLGCIRRVVSVPFPTGFNPRTSSLVRHYRAKPGSNCGLYSSRRNAFAYLNPEHYDYAPIILSPQCTLPSHEWVLLQYSIDTCQTPPWNGT